MGLPQSTPLAKLNALLSFVALVLFIVAFSSNYWLEKYFFFPVNAGGVKTMPVKANIGLFTACKVEYYFNNQSSENCSPDGGKNDFTYFDYASAYINFANRSRIFKKKNASYCFADSSWEIWKILTMHMFLVS